LQGTNLAPPLFSSCLRNTHLQPPYLLVDRPPIDGRPGEVRGCAGCSHSLPSPSLVKTVLQALTRRSTCWTWAPFRAGHVAPVSDSLQAGIGFFQHPVPHLRRRSLRSACLSADGHRAGTTLASDEGEKIGPCSDRNDPGRRELDAQRRGGKIGPDHRSGGDTGFPRSAPEVHAGVDACYRPGAAPDREGLPFSAPAGHLTVWSKPLSLFGLFSHDDRSSQVHVRSPCPLSSPYPGRDSREGSTLSRFRAPRDEHASAHCPGRS